MRKLNLTPSCICGHTPTPKQTTVSKSHKSPHISSSVWGTLTHSLTPYIFGWHISAMLYECAHTLHWSFIGSPVKGCLRERRKCSKQKKWKNAFSHSLLSLSLSLSLLSITFPFSLSLFTFFTFLLWPTPSIHTEAVNEALTIWKSMSDNIKREGERTGELKK